MEQHLIEAISEGVATLTLNRPDRLNALSTPIMEGLLEALPRLARDAAVGVGGRSRVLCGRRRQEHGRGVSRAQHGRRRDPSTR
jgi:2-(1,2-epoxy-1,2-dihydrophenyl)acetyl-CoA isomerase